MTAGVWRKNLQPGEGKTPNSTSKPALNDIIPKGILDIDKSDLRGSAGRISEEVEEEEEEAEEEEEVEDGEPVLGEEEYRRLLYPQTELICRNRVERQLVLITVSSSVSVLVFLCHNVLFLLLSICLSLISLIFPVRWNANFKTPSYSYSLLLLLLLLSLL